ncbi:MAG: hypothetical protein J5I53_03220 [Bradyrhizobiaceae bacterium]|nr:hypothetical protein [Bradyrhizobiaceae bacterium]
MKTYTLLVDLEPVEVTETESLSSIMWEYQNYRNTQNVPVEVSIDCYDSETDENCIIETRTVPAVNAKSNDLREDVLDRLERLYGKPSSYKYFTTADGATIRVADHSGNPEKNGRVDLDVVICDVDFTDGKFNSTTKGLQFDSRNTAEEIVAAIVARIKPN